jgi:glutathione S-transferase
VPVLEDGQRHFHESTAILRYLEETYPRPPLLPDGVARQAECWLLEDWADAAFMELTRRLAYWNLIRSPGQLEALWFPQAGRWKKMLLARTARRILARRFRISASRNARDESEAPRVARLALDRLGARPHLFDERITVADVALAAMAAPLRVAVPAVRDEPAVARLLDWGDTILGPEIVALYARGAATRRPPASR